MTIIERLNLRPMPVFEAAGAEGAGAAGGAAAKPATTALESGGEGGGDTGKSGAGEGGDGQGGAQPPELPENWREFFADDDDGKKEIGRFKSPKDVTKALLEQKKKIRQGLDPNEPAPEDPEKLAEWRKARGVPDKPTEYKVPDAIQGQLRDIDKPIVSGYFEFMHKKNATQAQIDAGLEYYFGMEAATAADRAEADQSQMKEAVGTLKEMWGPDFKANSAIAKRAAVDLVPDTDFYNARLPDGRLLGNVAEFSDLLVQLGLMKWGEGAYEQGEGRADAVADELETLRKKMKTDIKAWRADKAGQARYQELLEQKDRRAAR